ncbi:hypothetical protein [Sphingomonas sp. G-3-2-10]|uniref:hypothetical protein n=1 Tax=Sphingomonas sp. G-3-2-10 TaxID=2728838 RepID=UPI001469BBC3|nr:hypothetical protein [Sphingomonas sp. G-3-2-10]NML07236.1 hypothetical protein [Sphingomonas sp. G-3-2-10]
MVKRVLLAATVLVALSACQEQAPQPKNEAVTPTAPNAPPTGEPDGNSMAPAGDLASWMIGTWSFAGECSTDLVVTYEADGRLENAGNIGTWKLDGDTVTETIHERVALDSEYGGVEKLKSPEQLRYTVSRTDQKHGVLTINGRAVPIQRC